MSAQEEAAGCRLVSAEEARGIIANGEAQIAAGWGGIGVLADVANTVVVQAEQIAAVLALHTGHHWCMNEDRSEVFTYGFGTLGPCPTARALGVTA